MNITITNLTPSSRLLYILLIYYQLSQTEISLQLVLSDKAHIKACRRHAEVLPQM